MPFIGDQGWFYLSARNILLTGKVPLVGITSSHTWLHQGPLWTYMLAGVLFVFKYNPISGAYLTALFGGLTALLMYKLGTLMFSKKTGVIAGLIYSCCPLVVIFDRMPYHPTPIPFFVVLYIYLICKWVNGNIRSFPAILFLLAILYNLELATFILFFPLLILLIYGLIKKRLWAKNLFNRKTAVFSLISIIVPMLPVIIYDFSNKFHQTIVFFLWVFYKPFNILINKSAQSVNVTEMIKFLLLAIQRLVFGPSLIVAALLFISSLFVLFYLVFKQRIQIGESKFILLFLLTFSTCGILMSGTPSDAYLPMIFPSTIFTISIFIEFIINKRGTKYLGILIFTIVIIGNVYSVKNIIFGYDFDYRMQAVNKVINLTKGTQYNLLGKGVNSQYESYTRLFRNRFVG
jgi:4-amino-4-deoxy-L-arabinose transferase-like glycosyltransferase